MSKLRESAMRKALADEDAFGGALRANAPAAGRGAATASVLADVAGAAVALAELSDDDIFALSPGERVQAIKRGVPAIALRELAGRMRIANETLIHTLGMSRATINRKVRQNGLLTRDESERVLGVRYLIGQVAHMVEESGDPTGFDPAQWVARWLATRVPALDGVTPATYMDTIEGQKLVANLLAMTQSGAYA